MFILTIILASVARAQLQRTWHQYIETGTIATDSYLNSSLFATYSFAFNYSKNSSSSFAVALSIKGVNILFESASAANRGRYSVLVKLYSATSSGLSVVASTLLPNNNIQRLGVVWLTVESSFSPYIQVLSFQFDQTSSPRLYSNSALIPRTMTSASTITNDDVVFKMINSLDLLSNPMFFMSSTLTSSIFSIFIEHWYSGNQLTIQIKSTKTVTLKLYYVKVSVLIYRKAAMQANYNREVFPDTFRSFSASNQLFTLPRPINQTAFFYGVFQIDNQYILFAGLGNEDINFATSVNNNILTYFSAVQRLFVNYIYFTTVPNCTNNTFWIAANNDCQACPNSTFYNLTSSTCQNCADLNVNCTSCTQTACLICLAPYQPSGIGCQLCSSIFPNCDQCNSSSCLSCDSSYYLSGGSCTVCSSLISNCDLCNSSTNCNQCVYSHTLYGGQCFNCSLFGTQCNLCNSTACVQCDPPYQPAGNACIICSAIHPQCFSCGTSGCTACTATTYYLSAGNCTLNCSNLDPRCSTCTDAGNLFSCQTCEVGYRIENMINCVIDCGDGIVLSSQQCDDQNQQDGDGCSSDCKIEEYFTCTHSPPSSPPIVSPSVCQLSSLNFTVISTVKSATKDEFTLTVDLKPEGLRLYEVANWYAVFSGTTHQLSVAAVAFSPERSRLRVIFSYNLDLEGQDVQVRVTPALAASQFTNISVINLQLPQHTANNLALYTYPIIVYSLSAVIPYLSMVVATISLLLFAAGCFGAKLAALEAIEVVQLSGLMILTVDNCAPTYYGLQYLSWSMGATILSQDRQLFYQETSMLVSARSQLNGNNPLNTFNISLFTFFGPLIAAFVLKVLSITNYKGNRYVQRAWKYALGTFSFYGLSFLSYGHLTSLALGIRSYEGTLSGAACLGTGAVFLFMTVGYQIALYRYPIWFGCFKKNLAKFSISHHYYLFASIERILITFSIVLLSPGKAAAVASLPIVVASLLLIIVKKPHLLGEWKRPMANKIVSAAICLLYIGSSVSKPTSILNQLIPIIILAVNCVVLGYSSVAAFKSLREYWSTRDERMAAEEKEGPRLSLEESQKMIMKEFQMKMMPNLSDKPALSRPIEHDFVDVNGWKWQNYPILPSLGFDNNNKLNLKFMRNSKAQKKEKDESQQAIISRKFYDEI